MPKTPTPSTISVNALITSWRDSERGRYGLATILTPDAPAEKAFFAINEHVTVPVLNESFECSIGLVRGRWRVVKMTCDQPPQVLELTGVIVELLEAPGLPMWKVQLEPGDGEQRFARLGSKLLNEVNLAWVDDGTPVRVRVELPAKGDGEILALLEPTAASVVASDADHPAKGYLAVSRKDWHADDQNDPKSLPFALHVPGTGAWPLLWVKPSELRKQGICSVASVPLSEPFNAVYVERVLDDAAIVLQSGGPEALANLVLEAIRVALHFDARRQAWRLERLRAPLSLREPEEDGETIDWVQAQVCELHQLKKDDDGERNVDKGSKDPAWKIWMDIDDRRLGRGKVSRIMPAQTVRQAGLEEGVKAIITLVSRKPYRGKPYWDIKVLHRSTPKREGV